MMTEFMNQSVTDLNVVQAELKLSYARLERLITGQYPVLLSPPERDNVLACFEAFDKLFVYLSDAKRELDELKLKFKQLSQTQDQVVGRLGR